MKLTLELDTTSCEKKLVMSLSFSLKNKNEFLPASAEKEK